MILVTYFYTTICTPDNIKYWDACAFIITTIADELRGVSSYCLISVTYSTSCWALLK